MLTEATRRRLAEFEGRKWLSRFEEDECEVCGSPYNVNPNYSDWNSVCPLLAKIHRDGNGDEFHSFAFDRCFNSDAPDGADVEAWIMGNFADPSHTAGLIAEWLERR